MDLNEDMTCNCNKQDAAVLRFTSKQLCVWIILGSLKNQKPRATQYVLYVLEERCNIFM